MADVRSLLKNERASRRIQHKHASYTATGTLLCKVCHFQLKSESLWEGHLRSAGHIMRVQKAQEAQDTPSHDPDTASPVPIEATKNKKRKASDDDDGTIHKRTRAANGLPENFFDQGGKPLDLSSSNPINEIRIPSRPATPLKQSPEIPKQPTVDELEWAAFEADIAAVDVPEVDDGVVISAQPLSAAELAAQSTADANRQRKEKAEAELEGDKEDAARKMEDELDEMEGLEERVRKMREKREALRRKESVVQLSSVASQEPKQNIEEDDDDDDDEDDDWDGFRLKG
jgi:zinc finger protein 830